MGQAKALLVELSGIGRRGGGAKKRVARSAYSPGVANLLGQTRKAASWYGVHRKSRAVRHARRVRRACHSKMVCHLVGHLIGLNVHVIKTSRTRPLLASHSFKLASSAPATVVPSGEMARA